MNKIYKLSGCLAVLSLLVMVGCENIPQEHSELIEVNCVNGIEDLSPGEKIMRIDHSRKPCEQEMENATCLMVQLDEDLCSDDWTYFYDEIEGFGYDEGFVYALKVKVEEVQNPPMDGSSLRYILVEVLSKEAKK